MSTTSEEPEAVARRLAALDHFDILDTPPEPEFDDVVLLAGQICRAPVALVSLVTDERQWFKARLGFAPCQTDLDQSVCRFALAGDDLFVIPDLSADPRTRDNPLVRSAPSIRFYAGAPLRTAAGVPIGSLCVIDTVPRPGGLTAEQQQGLRALGRQVMALLEGRRLYHVLKDAKEAEHAITSGALTDERRVAAARERFVAILAHDLRNPIAAVAAALKLLEKAAHPDRAPALLGMMRQSLARMRELVDSTLDFARARMGGGIGLNSNADEPLTPVLGQVLEELRAKFLDAVLVTCFDLTEDVHCDRARIAQLLSNLLGNALTHGSRGQPVDVAAYTVDGVFTLSVGNAGKAIPPSVLARLFQPFSHGTNNHGDGLGLGLYIAAEIARSHGGTLIATSSDERTQFVFQMPTRPPLPVAV